MPSKRTYRIGGLRVCFSGYEPAPDKGDYLSLFASDDTDFDILIETTLVPTLDYPVSVTPQWEDPTVRNCLIGTQTHRYFRRNWKQTGADYAHLFYENATPHLRHLELCDRGFALTERQILASIGSEELFLHFGRNVFHSSCVDIGGQALLFSGVSGIGKSTQARLWETYAGATVKNGDRNLLRFDGKRELACGLPYAGTSGICSAYELPIRAIVFLSQAKTNELTRLPQRTAMRSLLSQFPVPKWSASAVSQAMDAAARIASHIPIYHLSCLPDQTAVEMLRKTLSEEV